MMADRTQHDPAAEHEATRRALQLASAENVALRNTVAEVVGYLLRPGVRPDTHGFRTIVVHPDDVKRWQAALAGQPMEGER